MLLVATGAGLGMLSATVVQIYFVFSVRQYTQMLRGKVARSYGLSGGEMI